jgi:hypothetical protein
MLTYSPQNTARILEHNPNASTVKTYRQWQAEGRQVRKGDRGTRLRREEEGEAMNGYAWIVGDIGEADDGRYRITEIEDGTGLATAVHLPSGRESCVMLSMLTPINDEDEKNQ